MVDRRTVGTAIRLSWRGTDRPFVCDLDAPLPTSVVMLPAPLVALTALFPADPFVRELTIIQQRIMESLFSHLPATRQTEVTQR
jgi:hypothetical protein